MFLFCSCLSLKRSQYVLKLHVIEFQKTGMNVTRRPTIVPLSAVSDQISLPYTCLFCFCCFVLFVCLFLTKSMQAFELGVGGDGMEEGKAPPPPHPYSEPCSQASDESK